MSDEPFSLDAATEADMPDVRAVWIMWGKDDDAREVRPEWTGCDHFQLRGALERALDYVNENFFCPPGEGDSAI